MNSLATLLLILTSIVIGYALPKHSAMAQLGERVLNALVFLILIIIGVEMAQVPDLSQKISNIALYLTCLLSLTIGFGLITLWLFDKFSPCPYYIKPIILKISGG